MPVGPGCGDAKSDGIGSSGRVHLFGDSGDWAERAGELNLPNYDIDSLGSLSRVIVRGELTDVESVQTANWPVTVHTLKVLAVLRGPVKAGESLRVLRLGDYHRAPGIGNEPGSWAPLGKGDEVFLFLRPDQDWLGCGAAIN